MALVPSLPVLLTERFQAVTGVDPELRAATKPQFGHFQSNVALRLAKAEGKPPREIAQRIIDEVDVADLCEPLELAGPGFINIRLRTQVLADVVTGIVTNPGAVIERAKDPQRVVIDYSAPNVAKRMHVGNLRSTIIGDCFARVLRAQGHTVIAQNHIGDWGTQFGMLVEQILFEGIDAGTLDLDASVALYRRAQEHFRSDETFADASRRRVVALQAGDEQTLETWRSLIEVSKAGFNRAYARLGVLLTDDDLAGESLYNDLLASVAADLEAAGIAVVDDGALVVFVPGDEAPLIVRKTDGGYGYAATDLAAVRYRFGQLDAQRIIYVVGSPQAHHFSQVFAVSAMAGWVPAGATLEHVGFGSVLGPDGKMFKTREGKAVTLDTLLDLAEDVAAPEIAMAAVKYADLSTSLHKDYVFDADRMVATTGNTGPYLQYAHARVSGILRKAEAEGWATDGVTVLDEPAEQALALLLSRFGEVVAEVAEGLQPHKLCTYLFETATALSSFYEKCPVLKSEGEVRTSRLALCTATRTVLAQGLDLLGIVAPERM
ncbi:MAG TPA: arginine--tRNA ligase [Micropruina sp.]|nr:arginine--tRNA ligase [Micropruina sp.]